MSPACEAVIAKAKRNAIRISGVNGIRALSRALNITVDDSADMVKTTTFVAQLNEFGIHLNEREQLSLSQWLDRTAEGIICPTEFIAALRHIDNPQRRSLVYRVVSTFDKDPEGNVALESVRRRFVAAEHPQVLCGEMSADEVQQHFESVFSVEANPSGIVSVSEFEQYCSALSAVIDSDERFAAMMRGCWQLPHFDANVTRDLATSKGGPTGLSCHMSVGHKSLVLLTATMRKALDDTIAVHRKTLLMHSAGFRALGCALRKADPADSGFVSRSDFLEALASVRLYVELEAVFNPMDVNRDGSIDYLWYLAALVGELAPARKLMAERLWRSLPTDRTNCVDLQWLHKHYVTHSSDELSLFYDTWDQRKARKVQGVCVVSAFEFVNEWLVPLSVNTAKDVQFEKSLKEHWPEGL